MNRHFRALHQECDGRIVRSREIQLQCSCWVTKEDLVLANNHAFIKHALRRQYNDNIEERPEMVVGSSVIDPSKERRTGQSIMKKTAHTRCDHLPHDHQRLLSDRVLMTW